VIAVPDLKQRYEDVFDAVHATVAEPGAAHEGDSGQVGQRRRCPSSHGAIWRFAAAIAAELPPLSRRRLLHLARWRTLRPTPRTVQRFCRLVAARQRDHSGRRCRGRSGTGISRDSEAGSRCPRGGSVLLRGLLGLCISHAQGGGPGCPRRGSASLLRDALKTIDDQVGTCTCARRRRAKGQPRRDSCAGRAGCRDGGIRAAARPR
jgi:hypothetical protein